MANYRVLSHDIRLNGSLTLPTGNIFAGGTVYLGNANNVSNPSATIYLAPPNKNGVGMDQFGGLRPISPSSVPSSYSWNVADKNNNNILEVFIDGSKQVKTANLVIDNGNGGILCTGLDANQGNVANVTTGLNPGIWAYNNGGTAYYGMQLWYDSSSNAYLGLTSNSGAKGFAFIIPNKQNPANQADWNSVATIDVNGNGTFNGSITAGGNLIIPSNKQLTNASDSNDIIGFGFHGSTDVGIGSGARSVSIDSGYGIWLKYNNYYNGSSDLFYNANYTATQVFINDSNGPRIRQSTNTPSAGAAITWGNTYNIWHQGNLANPAQTTGATFTGTISGGEIVLVNGTAYTTLGYDSASAGIELGIKGSNIGVAPSGTTPYIDFHYGVDGTTSQDYNARIINDGNNILSINFNNGSGTLRINNNTAYHAGNLNVSTFVLNNTDNQSVTGNFTVNGAGNLFLGETTSGVSYPNLVVRDWYGNNRIQLDGAKYSKYSGVNVYIDGSGNASFNGQVSVNSLTVTSSSVVTNLNAQMVNGVTEPNLAKNQSIYELGGMGVYNGIAVTAQSVPNMTVQIASGTVYTNTGRRVVLSAQNQTINTADATYTRYDVIYITGSSSGNEGVIGYMAGTPSNSPTEPTIPSDAVKLARVTVTANMGSVQNSNLTDERQFRAINYFASDNSLVINTNIYTDYIGANYNNTVELKNPIKASGWATTLTFTSGNSSQTWTHNLNLSSYAITFSQSSPERHVYWDSSSKTANSVIVKLDDIDNDETVYVDCVITAY